MIFVSLRCKGFLLPNINGTNDQGLFIARARAKAEQAEVIRDAFLPFFHPILIKATPSPATRLSAQTAYHLPGET